MHVGPSRRDERERYKYVMLGYGGLGLFLVIFKESKGCCSLRLSGPV